VIANGIFGKGDSAYPVGFKYTKEAWIRLVKTSVEGY
jgi:hypothetical protein